MDQPKMSPPTRPIKRARVETGTEAPLEGTEGSDIPALFKLLLSLTRHGNWKLQYFHLFHFVERHMQKKGFPALRKFIEKAFPPLPSEYSKFYYPTTGDALLTYLCHVLDIPDRHYKADWSIRQLFFRKEMRMRFKKLKYHPGSDKYGVSILLFF